MVSIIVPVYNTEKELPRCIESILSQTYQNLELILVDDASTDGSWNVLCQYGKVDNRIRLFHFEENRGNGMVRNFGIDQCKGDFVYFVDSDDYIETNALELMVQVMEREVSDILLLAHNDEMKGVKFRRKIADFSMVDKNDYVHYYLLQQKGFHMAAWKYFVKRNLLVENEIKFDESGLYYEDVYYTAKLVISAHHISSLKHPVYNYVCRTNSIMTSYTSKHIHSHLYEMIVLKDLLKAYNMFEKYRQEYSVLFLYEAFFIPSEIYTRMEEKNEKDYEMLNSIAESPFVQEVDLSLIRTTSFTAWKQKMLFRLSNRKLASYLNLLARFSKINVTTRCI